MTNKTKKLLTFTLLVPLFDILSSLSLMIEVEQVDSLSTNLLHTKLSLLSCTFDWLPSSIATAIQHYHWTSSLVFNAGLQHFGTPQPTGLHYFNWSSTLCLSTTHWYSLLQLVFSSPAWSLATQN